MRADPFYGGRTPRTLICLPINNQGTQAGVILLSSMTTASSQAQSASAREVISCLATFATIVTSNYSFTHRLKLEVDQRTQELTNALQAKTQFLSQCSHELRSPLSAVLVSPTRGHALTFRALLLFSRLVPVSLRSNVNISVPSSRAEKIFLV